MKRLLRRLLAQTLVDLDVAAALRQALAERQDHLAGQKLLVLAFGKAARPMAQALVESLPEATLRGLVVPPEADAAPLPPFEVLSGGHPLPTAGSWRAAARALELARTVRPDEQVVFLVSGGGSAMLELPADPTVTVDQWRDLYRALVGSGAGIGAINTVRRHLSAIKGGRLALAAGAAPRQWTLAIRDVPDDAAPCDLASGPTMVEPTTLADCRAVLDQFGLWSAVPTVLHQRLANGDLPVALPPGHALVARSEFVVLQDPERARASLQRHARSAGLLVTTDQRVDDWPCERAAQHLLQHLAKLHRAHPGRRVAVLTGGELSVPLPNAPGLGGRNQQFALTCARLIRGRPITVLSAGTDGIDGNSCAAGAIVDGATMQRARSLGFDGHDHLRRFDAFPLLHALGDTVITGATGTNLRDLRLLVHTG